MYARMLGFSHGKGGMERVDRGSLLCGVRVWGLRWMGKDDRRYALRYPTLSRSGVRREGLEPGELGG